LPHILIVNPNTSEVVTAWLVAEARRVAADECTIVGVNAPSGVGAIQTPAELALAGTSVMATMDAHPDVDAVIIAAFGDPGLHGARAAEAARAVPRPVVGLAESGLLAAGQGGRRFAIVTMGTAMEDDVAARVASLGLARQVTATLFLPVVIPDLIADRAAKRSMIADAVRRCADQSDAEAVLLGGAPLAGLAAGLAEEMGIVVLDGVAASVMDCLQRFT
jgi:Asp/Glu/hydantoin racemase